MAILRVKDENGNVIEIPAIKGDKGDVGPQGPQGPPGESIIDYETLNAIIDEKLEVILQGVYNGISEVV